ncbi:MAG: SDR family oxidoreductase [Selenomonadaceae bacterium]|nr:SDR family oxidoreductase [Selenomonadaceae bacterium]
MTDVRFHFDGKAFIVVGASSGFGKQIAQELAASGAHVLAVARNKERLETLQATYPERIQTACLDVRHARKTDWDELLQPYLATHGKLHGGVYTAGISGLTPMRYFSEQEARDIVETSFWGFVFFLQAVTRKKVAERGSSFVAFSSVAATWGNKGMFAYSAAKSAVQTAVRSFAKEISADGHRLNSISPGYVGGTGMTAASTDFMGRPETVIHQHALGTGTVADVAGLTLFLLSDRARWITGTDIVADGGYLLGGSD